MSEEFSLADLGLPAGEPSPGDRLGSVVSGCHVEQLLGRGGMGAVYLARQEPAGRMVVVKFLAPEVARDVHLRARFQREWEALRKIGRHPNVVEVFAVCIEDHEPHLVMEYVEGSPLRRALQEHGRMPFEQVLRVGRDVARGLAAIHALGLIHRDIKPDNVLVTPAGIAKIVDFGLAKDVFMTSLTMPGQLLGTASYMAPEQWGQGPKEDSRCDLFALGATLYHLTCGRPPFAGADVSEIAERCRTGDFAAPRELLPDIPEGLELILLQLLEPELEYRYARADAVVADCEAALAGRSGSAACLTDAAGRRFSLVGRRRFTLGSDPARCQIRLQHPSVSARHAQLRREDEGYVLRNIKSSGGTFVGGRPLEKPRLLLAGDEIRLGDVSLRFLDPRGAEAGVSPLAEEAARRAVSEPLLEALVAARDPRVMAHLLEGLTPDPVAAALASRTLSTLLGQAAAPVLKRRAQLERSALTTTLQLESLTGRALGDDRATWLGWWCRARLQAPAQVGASGPKRSLSLCAREGAASPAALPLSDRLATLLGRDPRCHMRLADPEGQRLQLTILRLHQRWVFVDARGPASTLHNGVPAAAEFLEPGDTLEVAGTKLVVVSGEPPPAREIHGLVVVDPLTFRALVDLKHPACAAGLVGLLSEDPAWFGPASDELSSSAAAQANDLRARLTATLSERARAARSLLPHLLGGVAGDPTSWRALLAERRATLPPQVVPNGWLSVTRSGS